MSYSESLTVRILGDSSQLQQELAQVEQTIDQLTERISSTSQSGQQIGVALSRVGSATTPLQQVSTLLSRVTQQANALSRQPISVNVQPAVTALGQLLQVLANVATRLRTLSLSGPSPARIPGNAAAPPPAVDRTGRPLAAGGLVSGPPGIDQVPARLTAGEFVLNRSAVETLGHGFVDRLNQRPDSLLSDQRRPQTSHIPPTNRNTPPDNATALRRLPESPAPSQQLVRSHAETNHHTTNHFGGITVQVTQPQDMESLVHTLQSQQFNLRNRRG